MSYQELAKWYVYKLIDPATGKPFYIGKGSGNRIDQHEAMAKSGKNGPKCDYIRRIWARGNQVEKVKVAEFWCERSAYNLETEMIRSHTGLMNIAISKHKPVEPDSLSRSIKDFIWESTVRNALRIVRFKSLVPKTPEQYHKDYYALISIGESFLIKELKVQ